MKKLAWSKKSCRPQHNCDSLLL